MPQTVDLSYALTLPPAEAIAYFQSKGYAISWDWFDTLAQANDAAFTVAKVTQLDILQDIRAELTKALTEGLTFEQFKKNLEPTLRSKGWWGQQTLTNPKTGNPQTVQLGSPWRLRTIYRTNMQTSLMRGRVSGLLENVEDRPWWQYVAVLDQRTRPTHRALDGKIFRYDDPFWKSFSPPLGFSCRCRLRARSDADLRRYSLVPESSAGLLSTGTQLLSQKSGIQVPTITYRDPVTGDRLSPDLGWNYDRSQTWRPNLQKYDADLQQQFNDLNNPS